MARPGCTDSVLGASLACLLILHSAVCAQVPEEFTNLQVLPKEIAKDDLEARMREFTFALNVKCSHCHVGPDNLQDMDFASDEKPTKRTARVMMRMTDEINGGFLRDIETGRDARVEVKCQTCHHRVQVPEPIEDIVTRLVADEGVESALAKYRELRESHYGSAAYDFSKVPLDKLADELGQAGKTDEAVSLLLENLEHFPEDTWGLLILGGIHKGRGEKEKAVATFRKVLEINPNSRWARGELAELEASDRNDE